MASDSTAEAFWQWNEFFLHLLHGVTPVLFFLYLDQRWIDITVGEPTNREFFSLKASLAALPLANEVPYSVDAESREFAKSFIETYGDRGSDSEGVTLSSRLKPALFLSLLLLALIVGYLRFAPGEYMPPFLRGAAEFLGNPGSRSLP